MRLPSRRKQGSEGFTLIEMMIVVVIVAVLVAVAIIAYTRHIRKTRLVKEKVFVAKIQALQETYFQQHGVYIDVTTGPGAYPGPLPTGDAVPFNPPLASNWDELGAKPESGHTYLQWHVVASTGPNHMANSVSHPASQFNTAQDAGLTNGVPWYFIYAVGDVSGDGAPNTEIYASSARAELWTQNEGD